MTKIWPERIVTMISFCSCTPEWLCLTCQAKGKNPKRVRCDNMAKFRIFETRTSAVRSAAQMTSKYSSQRTFGGFFRMFRVEQGGGGWKVIEYKKR